jgi:hypothetical protein
MTVWRLMWIAPVRLTLAWRQAGSSPQRRLLQSQPVAVAGLSDAGDATPRAEPGICRPSYLGLRCSLPERGGPPEADHERQADNQRNCE